MNKAAALKLLEVYEERILDCASDVGLIKSNAREMLNNTPANEFDTLGHCITMFPRMILMIQIGDIEKFCRWLGFVQAILWSEGKYYTVEELKDHNRAVFAGKPNVVFNNGHTPHSSEDEEGYGGK